MAYTPSGSFAFAAGSYTPSAAYVFTPPDDLCSGSLSGTLDGLSGTLTGHVADNQGAINGSLADLSGSFSGANAPQGVASGLLADLSGAFSGINAPKGIVSGTLADLTGTIVGQLASNVGLINGVLADIGGEVEGHFDYNVHRFTVAAFRSAQEPAAKRTESARLPVGRAEPITLSACSVRGSGEPVPMSIAGLCESMLPCYPEVCSPMDRAENRNAGIAAPVEALTPIDRGLIGRTDDATDLRGAWVASLDLLEFLRILSRMDLEDSGQTLHTLIRVIHDEPPEGYRYTPGVGFAFPAPADYTPAAAFVSPYTVPSIDLAETISRGVLIGITRSSWQIAARIRPKLCVPVDEARKPPPGKSPWIDPPRPDPETPPGHVVITLPTQSVYTMQHVITVETLADSTEVPMSQVSLSLNAGAYAWQFSGTLADPGALSLVQLADNEPVQLAVTVDGYVWHVIVEEIEHTRQFGKQSIGLKGRSLSALLGAPYFQPASAAYGSDLTVQQLAELQLPVGWTLDWEQETWLVPGGAYSYTNQTPIQALAGLAADTGSMLVPARSGQSLAMKPRYPVWPWEFAGVEPDLAIPEAAILSVGLRPRLGTQANGVYVHGGDIGGVLAWCRFNGSDGARLASTVSNNLMTDVIGCRALGSRILAGQYTQPMIKSLTLPLDGDVFPLAEIGQLAAITIGGETERGIINSVSIEAGLGRVSQTVQIGEETANVWALFKELLPRDPLLIGTLASTDGTTSVMTLIDGGVVSVRGTGTAGGKYYLRSGRIEGEAPAMAQQEVVV